MKTTLFYIFLIVVGLMSCEDIIVLDLKNTEVKPVIVGLITNDGSPVHVNVSQSQEFYDSTGIDFIQDAIVSIRKENETEIFLTYDSDGNYFTDELQGEENTTYTLKVEIGENTYEATSTIPATVIPIDSIGIRFRQESIFFDEGLYPIFYYVDPENEDNFYRFNITVNNQPYDFNRFEDDEDPDFETSIQLYNDRFTNGGRQDFDLPYRVISGDVVSIELQHLDPFTYEYLNTLQDISNGSGVAPSDPISNFGATALGYFGAYSLDVKEIVVP